MEAGGRNGPNGQPLLDSSAEKGNDILGHTWRLFLRRYMCLSGIILFVLACVTMIIVSSVKLATDNENLINKTDNTTESAAIEGERKAHQAHHKDDTNAGLLIDITKCNKSTCNECERSFAVEYIPFEAKRCGDLNPKVVNSTCFKCYDECLTTDDIEKLWNESMRICEDSKPTPITCCLISSMQNLNKPSRDGTFQCFTDEIHKMYNSSPIQPLFHCEHGKTGARCEKLNKVPFNCKCYTFENKFLDQENMAECSAVPIKPNCYASINGQNCICSRRHEEANKMLIEC